MTYKGDSWSKRLVRRLYWGDLEDRQAPPEREEWPTNWKDIEELSRIVADETSVRRAVLGQLQTLHERRRETWPPPHYRQLQEKLWLKGLAAQADGWDLGEGTIRAWVAHQERGTYGAIWPKHTECGRIWERGL